ncbi:hypothetical protein [Sinomonas atrocyanea]
MSTVLHTHTGPAAGGVDSDGTGARPARKRRTVSEAELGDAGGASRSSSPSRP